MTEEQTNYAAHVDELDVLKAQLEERDITIANLQAQLEQLQKFNQRLALAFSAINAIMQGLQL